MVDYEEMYNILFQKVTKAILILQEAQVELENEEVNIQIFLENETEAKPVKYSTKRIRQEPLKFD